MFALQWFPAVPSGNAAFTNVCDHGLLAHRIRRGLLDWAIWPQHEAKTLRRPCAGDSHPLPLAATTPTAIEAPARLAACSLWRRGTPGIPLGIPQPAAAAAGPPGYGRFGAPPRLTLEGPVLRAPPPTGPAPSHSSIFFIFLYLFHLSISFSSLVGTIFHLFHLFHLFHHFHLFHLWQE